MGSTIKLWTFSDNAGAIPFIIFNSHSHNTQSYIYSFFAIDLGLSCILPRNSESFSLPRNGFGMEFREFASIFVPRSGIPSCFSLPQKGLERNSESLLLFLLHGTEFRVVSLLWKGSERNYERFLFRGTARIPSEIAVCSVYSIFRGIIFCRKFPTLDSTLPQDEMVSQSKTFLNSKRPGS